VRMRTLCLTASIRSVLFVRSTALARSMVASPTCRSFAASASDIASIEARSVRAPQMWRCAQILFLVALFLLAVATARAEPNLGISTVATALLHVEPRVMLPLAGGAADRRADQGAARPRPVVAWFPRCRSRSACQISDGRRQTSDGASHLRLFRDSIPLAPRSAASRILLPRAPSFAAWLMPLSMSF
jgi:hypothetical protein